MHSDKTVVRTYAAGMVVGAAFLAAAFYSYNVVSAKIAYRNYLKLRTQM